jgi:uncharacterized SAM-binding protein YcdF (DUF218 family)
MSRAGRKARMFRSGWPRLLAALLVAAIVYPSWLGFQVWRQSHRDENHTADAIVVLGAAQYNGTPSPIFKARLDHAAYLYEQRFSRTVIVTGGKREGDRFTESEAGELYLVERGIPTDNILNENNGRTSLESLRNVWDMAQAHGIKSVLLVSDPMHSERIKRMAIDLGFTDVYSSPASYISLNRSRATKARELFREIASIVSYELLGGD